MWDATGDGFREELNPPYKLLQIALSRWSRAGAACGPPRLLRLRSRIGDAPDGTAGVVGDQQRAVLGDRQRHGASPDLGATEARQPESGHEILVKSLRAAILERHA